MATETLAFITKTRLPLARAGVAYSVFLQAYGGNPASYTYALTAGTLPTGLSLNTSTGEVSGTPAASSVGSHSLTFRVTDASAATASSAVTVKVTPDSFSRTDVFRLDSDISTVIGALLLDGVSPEAIAAHFLRDLQDALPGYVIAHVAQDILVSDWPVAGVPTDVPLTDALTSASTPYARFFAAKSGDAVADVATDFVLAYAPVHVGSTLLMVNGQKQRYGTDYTVAGDTVSFLNVSGRVVLLDGDEIEIYYK
jgi:hypothetical protein